MIGISLGFFLVILAVVFFIYKRWESSDYVQSIDLIPGPKRKPIVGDLPSMPRETDQVLQIIQVDWVKKFGAIYQNWFAFQSFIRISSPPLIEKIMSSQVFIDKGKSYSILTPWLGKGLLLASGNRWRKSRRLLTPAFHFQILDNFFDVFNKNADILCNQMAKYSQMEGQSCCEIDVFPFVKKCTLDIICETAMGIQINAQLEDSEYIRNVHEISEIVVERFFSIGHFLPDWAYQLFTAGGRRHFKILKKNS